MRRILTILGLGALIGLGMFAATAVAGSKLLTDTTTTSATTTGTTTTGTTTSGTTTAGTTTAGTTTVVTTTVYVTTVGTTTSTTPTTTTPTGQPCSQFGHGSRFLPRWLLRLLLESLLHGHGHHRNTLANRADCPLTGQWTGIVGDGSSFPGSGHSGHDLHTGTATTTIPTTTTASTFSRSSDHHGGRRHSHRHH